MALLNVISPNFHPKLPSFPHCKRDPHVDITRTRFFSLRKGSHTLRCAQEEAVLIQYADEETVELKYAEERVVPSTQILGWGEPVKKSDFPKDFLFGAGSSAVQTEGAWDKDGKGPSVWDHYAQKNNLPNVDDAIKSYDFYKEDIKLLKHMGMKTYRFSIAWPRILPKGSLRGGINDAGIKHYQNFIKELKDNHIEPFVTLFHFDYPQALEDEYGGLLSRRFVDDFTDYCDICFANFGKDVKYWTLINEPNNVAKFGYDIGGHPPARGSIWSASAGNSAREPYIATHHLILAHAAGSKLYRDKYKEIYHDGKGEIGMSLSTAWIIPQSDSLEDKRAAERQREFDYGWYLGPLYDGDYPEIMKSLVKDRLPDFTPEEKEMIKGSIDFLGVNYYTASFVRSVPITDDPPISYCRDSFTESLSVDQDGNEIAPLAEGSLFVRVYPEGLKKLLVYLKGKYENPKIIVTENGVSTSVKTTPNLSTAYKDKSRTEFIQKHLIAIRDARKEGANVHGYFYWSLMDSFEFFDGYGTRFGLNFTDFTDTKTYARDQKGSAEWFKKFLGNHFPWWS